MSEIKIFMLVICSIIIVLIISAFVYDNSRINAVAEMVKNGADPISAGCAIGTINHRDNICSFHIGKNLQIQDK